MIQKINKFLIRIFLVETMNIILTNIRSKFIFSCDFVLHFSLYFNFDFQHKQK